jgi:hypothetical protein
MMDCRAASSLRMSLGNAAVAVREKAPAQISLINSSWQFKKQGNGVFYRLFA